MNNTVYPFDGNNANVGVAPISLPNEDLKWETTEQWNLGLDLGFFDERISFTADLYRKTTRDLFAGCHSSLLFGLSDSHEKHR